MAPRSPAPKARKAAPRRATSPVTHGQAPAEQRRLWAANLVLARKAAGYATQHDLAEALGCTRAAVSLWENGGTAPRDAARRELAVLLNLTVAELFPADLALVAVGEVAA